MRSNFHPNIFGLKVRRRGNLRSDSVELSANLPGNLKNGMRSKERFYRVYPFPLCPIFTCISVLGEHDGDHPMQTLQVSDQVLHISALRICERLDLPALHLLIIEIEIFLLSAEHDDHAPDGVIVEDVRTLSCELQGLVLFFS